MRGNIGSDAVTLTGNGMSPASERSSRLAATDDVHDASPAISGADEHVVWHKRFTVRAVFWVFAVSLAMGVTEMFKSFVAQEAQHRPIPLHVLVEQNIPWWLCCALLSPPVFLLAQKFRLDDRDHFLSRLPIHFVAAAAFATVHITITGVLYFYG